eukprot:185208_1
MDLISRIHVYFIHSYHINRFTMDELRMVNEQIECCNLNDDALEDMRMQLLTDLMKTKRNIIGIGRHNDKFNEPVSTVKHTHQSSEIDYTKMRDILQKHDINIVMNDLRSAFNAFTGRNDKDILISAIVDAYYALNDTSLPLSNDISITSLHSDYTHRHTIYGIILFHYFEKCDINNANFIKIAERLLANDYPFIDITQFRAIASSANINGNTFIKGTQEYKNSIRFAKLFKSIKGYKKKDFTNMYVKINSSWDAIEVTEPDNVEINDHNTEIVIEHTESKHNPNPPTQHNEANERHDIYEIGTQFYYWHSLRDHKHNPNPPTQHNEANERHDIYEIGTQFYYWHSLRDHKHNPNPP